MGGVEHEETDCETGEIFELNSTVLSPQSTSRFAFAGMDIKTLEVE
jgi:hypothetical protein